MASTMSRAHDDAVRLATEDLGGGNHHVRFGNSRRLGLLLDFELFRGQFDLA